MSSLGLSASPSIDLSKQPPLVTLDSLGDELKPMRSVEKLKKSIQRTLDLAHLMQSQEKRSNFRAAVYKLSEESKQHEGWKVLNAAYFSMPPRDSYGSNNRCYIGSLKLFESEVKVFALFSGNQSHVAKECREWLPGVIVHAFAELGEDGDCAIAHVLKHTTQILDAKVKSSESGADWATVGIAMVAGERLWVANCGDIRIFVCGDNYVKPMSYDARMSDSWTRLTVLKRARKKNIQEPRFRLNRCIGSHLEATCARSKISFIDLKSCPKDATLLMVNRAVTRVATNDEIHEMIDYSNTAYRIAESVARSAAVKAGGVDISVVAVKLFHQEKSVEKEPVQEQPSCYPPLSPDDLGDLDQYGES